MIRKVFFIFILLFFVCTTVHAASDVFTSRVLIGSDTTPPSTPAGLVATPVAQTQINLAWGASTDDISLGGYKVFRNTVQIATTTLATYSDTGLSPSTAYTYFVKAFDDSFNTSSSSNIVSTTTFATPATSTPPSSSPSGGNETPIKLVSFTATPFTTSTQLKWETTQYAQFELRWGRTSSYELGFVTNEVFKRENDTVISDLEPGSVYEYELIAYNRSGERTLLSQGQFRTLDIPDETAPANVSNLKAILQGKNILLTWDNPDDPDFAYVRVVRSYLFYPVDSYDGFIAYQGNGEFVSDKNAATQKQTEYYTVFSFDTKGNISSGAIVKVEGGEGASLPVATSTDTLNLVFEDIEILQNGMQVDSTDINVDLPLTFRIAYEKLPEHLKTITISLEHPRDQEAVFSFLLKINKDKTYYEAAVAPLHVTGTYPAEISVFDYQVRMLHSLEGSLYAKQSADVDPVFGIPLTTKMTAFPEVAVLFWSSLLMLVLYILYAISKNLLAGKQAFIGFEKLKFLSAFAAFVTFGGTSAFLLFSVSKIQHGAFSNTSAAASVSTAIPSLPNLAIFIALVLALLLVALGILSFCFFKRK